MPTDLCDVGLPQTFDLLKNAKSAKLNKAKCNKMRFACIYNRILFMRKKGILPFVTTFVLSEINQTEKEDYLYDIVYMWNLKKPNS